ncbi:CHAT domain-containing protein [Pseudonocardia kunmingensis]|uniref:CHAT domain-containing protein n=1 Tax=Pseudonocardia kunmingensis TaxID=630975 RepID=A0A543DN84_9PSEU|nr:CHAT domain-containing protein [Pseudonocardia kunmingensis]TQM10794.1 CHAT domain-containing protein [Pseudonocardia kunmingensis]
MPDHDPADREELLRRVTARVNASAGGDHAAVTGPDAPAEAEALLAHVATPAGVDLQVLYAAGMLHWNRWSALAPAGTSSGDTAQLLMTPAFLMGRPGIPPQLAEFLAPQRIPPESDPAGHLYQLGSAFAAIAVALDRPVIDETAAGLLEGAVETAGADDPRLSDFLSAVGEVRLRLHEADDDGSGEHLDRAVVALREACRVSPATGADLVPQLVELARALGPVVWRTEDPAPLREAVDVLHRALRDARGMDRDEALAVAVHLLPAGAGRPRADGVGPAFLAVVVEAARRSLRESTPDDPLHPVRTAHLGLALDHLGDATDDTTATSESVRMLCAALPLLDGDGSTRTAVLSALRNRLLLDRTSPLPEEVFGLAVAAVEQAEPDPADPALLLAARAAAHHAIARRSPGDEQKRRHEEEAVRALDAALLSGTAGPQVLAGFRAIESAPSTGALDLDRSEDRERWEAVTEMLRGLVTAVPTNRALLPLWLADLADLLRHRCDWRAEPDVVDEAIAVHRRLLGILPRADHQRATDLGFLLLTRSALAQRDPALLTEAVEVLDGVVDADEVDAQTRATALYHRSSGLTGLALAGGDVRAARDAVAAVRDVVERGEPVEAMPTSWHNLATARFVLYESTGDGLADAIAAARRAVALGQDEPGQAERTAFLAQLLGVAGEVDEAASLARRALADGGPDERQGFLQDALGEVLRRHHLRFGGAGELDESVAHLRAAADDADDPVSRTIRLLTLASALRARYSTTGDLATLDAAIATGRRGARELPPGHRVSLVARANLATALTTRYERTRDARALAEAIAISRQVVAATPPGHPALPLRLSNLGRALTEEFRRTDDPRVLDEVIDTERRAVDCAGPADPNKAMMLSNLAASLNQRRTLTGDPFGGEAVRIARAAVAATPPDHPALCHRMINLAVALSTPWRLLLRAREVMRVAEAAARLPSAPASERLRACRYWGHVAAMRGRWDSAAQGFAEGVRLLPRVAARNLTRGDAEHQLTTVDGVHLDAAACAVRAGDAAEAISVLEQGRGLLLSYALDARTERTDLHAAAPDLAEEVERLLEELDAVGEALPEEEADQAAALDHRHALAARWDATMARVRELPGFERFGEPPTVAELLPAASDGPVITVVVSEHGCHALVVTTAGVRAVALPGLTADEVGSRARAFLRALDVVGSGGFAERMDAQAEVRETLGWLWDAVAGPVLDALGIGARTDGPWPRVWWSPTGMLTFLPLHAAGHHDGSGRAVLDRVVSSYTPTLRALRHARARPANPDPALVAVTLSQTPGQQALPATAAEAAELARTASRAVQLRDGEAGFDAVVGALAAAGWAHFACHAVSDPLSPSESRLLLHDRPLAVRDISRLRLRHAELAFLSACSTARGHEELADEAIHIASAFQVAGYRHVVGTLWPVLDATSARLAADFYERHRAGAPAAEALHAVVRELRDAHPLLASTWAAHVHSGP